MRNLAALGALVLVVGCSSGPSIVGTWDATGVKNIPEGAKTTMTFSSPDKMTMVSSFQLPIPSTKVTITATVNGTYKLEGDTLTIKGESADVKTEGLPDSMKAGFDQTANLGKQQMLDEINKNSGAKVKWEGNDTVVVTGEGTTMTLTRQKG